jgi:hypothetical protein
VQGRSQVRKHFASLEVKKTVLIDIGTLQNGTITKQYISKRYVTQRYVTKRYFSNW